MDNCFSGRDHGSINDIWHWIRSIDLVFLSKLQDWSKYSEQKDPGTSTDIFDIDEAKQTTSLLLQQPSAMVAEGGDDTPLPFATQTAATITDLEIEVLNPMNPLCPM